MVPLSRWGTWVPRRDAVAVGVEIADSPMTAEKRSGSIVTGMVINRCAAVIRPKQPFVDWVQSMPTKMPLLHTAEDIRKQPVMYLIPEYDFDHEALKWVHENFDRFFMDSLESWWTEEVHWPKPRTLEMFQAWFEVEVFEIVEDVVGTEIEEEDLGSGKP